MKNGISNRRREGQKCEIRGIDVTFVDDSYCRERGLSFITIRKHAGSSLTFHTQQTHIYIVRVWAEVLIFNYSNIWKFGSASLHHSRLVHTHRCNVEKLKTFPFHRSARSSQFSSTLSFHGHITLNECVEENVSIHSPHCTTARYCCYEKKNRESVPIFSIMLNKNRVVDKLNDLLTHAVFCRSMCVNGRERVSCSNWDRIYAICDILGDEPIVFIPSSRSLSLLVPSFQFPSQRLEHWNSFRFSFLQMFSVLLPRPCLNTFQTFSYATHSSLRRSNYIFFVVVKRMKEKSLHRIKCSMFSHFIHFVCLTEIFIFCPFFVSFVFEAQLLKYFFVAQADSDDEIYTRRA